MLSAMKNGDLCLVAKLFSSRYFGGEVVIDTKEGMAYTG